MIQRKKIKIGDLLMQNKVISENQLNSALAIQKKSGRKLGRVLIENNFIEEDKLLDFLSQQLQIPFVELRYYKFSPDTVRLLNETYARRFRTIVLEEKAGEYLIGMADPTDIFAYDEIARVLKRPLQLAVVRESDLLRTFDTVYRRTDEIIGFAEKLGEEMTANEFDLTDLAQTADVTDAPVVKLLQSMFEDAVQIGASDIHIEPQEAHLHIRFRIDGTLYLQTEADKKIAPTLMLRLKLISGLDISEKRLPQDGRFSVRVRDQAVDVRISTMPTQYGEAVVMRLLNQAGGFLTLDKLGMPPDMLARFREIIRRSNGMVLVTGPTGSGKTTTLYAALAEINTLEQKIITVEDPVEYRLPGITQVQVNEKIDLTFSRVLRSALRQDPDIILVGEMRDAETAHIGLTAAMTGHLVFSTLHTRDAASTLFRLVDMGTPKYMVASSVQVVLAQRLLRRVCESCSEPHNPTPQEVERLEHEGFQRDRWGTLLHGRGCSHCNGIGYSGRLGVYEMLEMTQLLVEAAAHHDSIRFMQAAREYMKGKTIIDHALEQMSLGHTSVAEVMRISNQVDD